MNKVLKKIELNLMKTKYLFLQFCKLEKYSFWRIYEVKSSQNLFSLTTNNKKKVIDITNVN